jgi:hypothetical protein
MQIKKKIKKPRPGRPRLFTDRNRRALKVVCETRQISSETITREFRSHEGKGWAHLVLICTTEMYVTEEVGLQSRVSVRILLIR